MNDVELDERDLARMLSLGRALLGTVAWIAPRRFARLWTGTADTASAAVPIATRGLAARDIALGLGTLMALEGDGPVRRWLEAQALADASDAASTLMAFGEMRGIRRWLALATASSSCYLALHLADSID